MTAAPSHYVNSGLTEPFLLAGSGNLWQVLAHFGSPWRILATIGGLWRRFGAYNVGCATAHENQRKALGNTGAFLFKEARCFRSASSSPSPCDTTP
nr:MAG TPA_asm: hypothetical protein [Caudoviricetes sp.]